MPVSGCIYTGLTAVMLAIGFMSPAWGQDAQSAVSFDDSSGVVEPMLSDTSAAAEAVEIDTAAIKRHNPMGAMWRSVFVPGWGQLYNRKYVKALIIGGAEIGFAYGVYYQHRRYKKAKREGNDVAAAFYKDDRNRLGWWLAGIILYSMADAYADAHLWDFELSPNLSMGLNPGCVIVYLDL